MEKFNPNKIIPPSTGVQDATSIIPENNAKNPGNFNPEAELFDLINKGKTGKLSVEEVLSNKEKIENIKEGERWMDFKDKEKIDLFNKSLRQDSRFKEIFEYIDENNIKFSASFKSKDLADRIGVLSPEEKFIFLDYILANSFTHRMIEDPDFPNGLLPARENYVFRHNLINSLGFDSLLKNTQDEDERVIVANPGEEKPMTDFKKAIDRYLVSKNEEVREFINKNDKKEKIKEILRKASTLKQLEDLLGIDDPALKQILGEDNLFSDEEKNKNLIKFIDKELFGNKKGLKFLKKDNTVVFSIVTDGSGSVESGATRGSFQNDISPELMALYQINRNKGRHEIITTLKQNTVVIMKSGKIEVYHLDPYYNVVDEKRGGEWSRIKDEQNIENEVHEIKDFIEENGQFTINFIDGNKQNRIKVFEN